MNELIIDFSPHGKCESLYSDKFDLGFLGKKQIVRATHVLFNEVGQHWYISLVSRPQICIGKFSSYESSVDFEILWLQLCRKKGIKPEGRRGYVLAQVLLNNSIEKCT